MSASEESIQGDHVLSNGSGKPEKHRGKSAVTPQRRVSSPQTFNARELVEMKLPPVRWAVPNLVPEGLTLLAGKPKLGKSWLALGLAVAVASGGVALGSIPVQKGEVLYLALEDNQRRLKKRLEKLLPDEEAPEGLHLSTHWPRMDEGGAEELERWMQEHPATTLIIVDVLKRVRPKQGRYQSLYDADYESVEAMQGFAAKHRIGIVVVHHTRKAGAEDPLDEISGSLGLSGGADGVLVLRRDRGSADAYLHADGRDFDGAAEYALNWDSNTVSWTIAGNAEESRMSRERAALLEVLKESGNPMTPTEVANALDKNSNSVKKLLWTMAKEGQVSSADGVYSVSSGNPGNPVTEDDEDGYRVTEVTEDDVEIPADSFSE